MARGLSSCRLLLVILFLFGCAQRLPLPQYETFIYDFIIDSPYALSEQHQNIYLVVDAKDMQVPEGSLAIKSLLLKRVYSEKKAQIIVHINVSNSFLIERPAGITRDVVFDENGKGRVEEIAILRSFIRTRYTIEIIDVLNDVLIEQVSGAGNYAIETQDEFNILKNKKSLEEMFYEELSVARYEVMNQIWNTLKADILARLKVTFSNEKFTVASEHENETRLAQAFEYLLQNNKTDAKKALYLYNAALKEYKGRPDELSKQLLQLIDHGITVSSAIVNHEHADRYPYEP